MKNNFADLDFEIAFYEKFLKERPHYAEALIALGDAYTKKGLYDKGLEIDRRLIKLRPDDPFVFYNLACSCSLLNLVDEAFSTLKKALKLGYRDFRWLLSDPDLENVRKDPRYSEIAGGFPRKKPKSKKVTKNSR
jgi:tetratricopeptide (TPR) repeat protein